ncbi:DUF1700 domain-containing protein [Clostridium sp. MB40-C1]|uniref:HAAS signaling domain-containing protein n=1 Tax=Clostridium sp. MB40-C1 TaxID=3070996 RepID=UPI0027DF8469|nr:DUF1700 domain-containing protein [Clostridium sp. MB40-C1]WMJ79847.1 DUF1700 domain-containing protein [Clostridium sp. MB40-C1]
MNKQQYLDILSKNLNVSKEEKEEIIYDYEEHFRVGMENGKSDEEIIKELGEPKAMAKQYSVYEFVEKAKEKPSPKNIYSAILAFMGMGFFNLIFVLGPSLAVAGILFALIVISFSIIISGAAFALAPILVPLGIANVSNIPILATPFLGIGFLALGILATRGSYKINKGFYKVIIKYIDKNIKIIKN